LGSKIDDDEKQQILGAIRETQDWLHENWGTLTVEDMAEQKQKLSDVVYPITSKLYGESDEPVEHDEL